MQNKWFSSKGAVEQIIIINIIMFIPFILGRFLFMPIPWQFTTYFLNLNINTNYFNFFEGGIWQLVTAMFLHGGLMHLIFNMYALYIFGKPLEYRWGKKGFLLFYLTTGILANVFTVCIYFLSGQSVTMVGASGAIFGVLLAFAAYYPDVTLYLYFALPIKTKWAIVLFAVLSLVFQMTGTMGGIGHMTHLFGFVAGYLYMLFVYKADPIKMMFFPHNHSQY